MVDTSIWVTHLRQGSVHLKELLFNELVVCHPFIIGELACGNLKNRKEIIPLLHSLSTASIVTHNELIYFIEQNTLMGVGIGFVDVHLLASAKLSKIPLWTSDKRLKLAANKLKVDYM